MSCYEFENFMKTEVSSDFVISEFLKLKTLKTQDRAHFYKAVTKNIYQIQGKILIRVNSNQMNSLKNIGIPNLVSQKSEAMWFLAEDEKKAQNYISKTKTVWEQPNYERLIQEKLTSLGSYYKTEDKFCGYWLISNSCTINNIKYLISINVVLFNTEKQPFLNIIFSQAYKPLSTQKIFIGALSNIVFFAVHLL